MSVSPIITTGNQPCGHYHFDSSEWFAKQSEENLDRWFRKITDSMNRFPEYAKFVNCPFNTLEDELYARATSEAEIAFESNY